MKFCFLEILSDYDHYSILILKLGLEYAFIKSYTNSLVISNIVSVCNIYRCSAYLVILIVTF